MRDEPCRNKVAAEFPAFLHLELSTLDTSADLKISLKITSRPLSGEFPTVLVNFSPRTKARAHP